MNKEAVIEKVRKLLARTSSPYEREAQTAMMLAQKFMAEHGLSMQDIEVTEISKEVVTEGATKFTTRLSWWYKTLSNVIADNFRCYALISIYDRSRRIVFIGLKEDATIAKEVYNFAVNAIQFNATRYVNKVRREGMNTKGVRNEYIIGFIRGLETKFKEQIATNEWGLVLVKDDAVEEYFNNLHKRKESRSRVQRSGNQEHYRAGYQDGKSFTPAAGLIS